MNPPPFVGECVALNEQFYTDCFGVCFTSLSLSCHSPLCVERDFVPYYLFLFLLFVFRRMNTNFLKLACLFFSRDVADVNSTCTLCA